MSIGVEWGEKFGPAFVKHVHELLASGYQDVRSKINANTDEVAISKLIWEAVEKRLDAPILLHSWYEQFELPHCERLVENENRPGTSSQRLDIVFVGRDDRPRPKFMFEAKRLKTNGFEIGKYTGAKGLGCFINEEYAENCPSAAMLGYLQSDDANRWFKELERKFDDDTLDELKIDQKLCSYPVIAELPNEWLSEHRRKTKLPIKIYHIFLDCQ